MKVLLISADSQKDAKLPNLALMKLSAHHKNKGDLVGFHVSNPDKVYVSVVFDKNKNHAQGIKTWYPNADVEIGGPGLGIPTYLPDEIEHIMPDYSLYPDLDYSMGFTTRGCFRRCDFCIVTKVEGEFREHAPIEEFHNPEFNKVVLMDNNFLKSKNRSKTIEYIRDNDLKVCISQGMDLRIITEEMAEELASINSYNMYFKQRSYIFAWDNFKEYKPIMSGLNEIIKAGIPPKQIMVYVLVGFDTEYWQDAYRLQTLADLGVQPYVMRYNFNRKDKILNGMARWTNSSARFFTACSLQDYKPLKKHTNKIWGSGDQTTIDKQSKRIKK